MTFSSQQDSVLTWLNFTFALFSLLGSSFIMFMYWKCAELRNFAFKMVFWIAFSDFFYAIGDMMLDSPSGSFACYLQALLISYFELSSMLWTVAIAFTLHITILRKDPNFLLDVEGSARKYALFCWGIPLVLAILPLTTSSYGDSGGWCWISTDASYAAGTAWRFVQFYGPLWLSIGYNIYVYIHITRALNAMLASPDSQPNAQEPDGFTQEARVDSRISVNTGAGTEDSVEAPAKDSTESAQDPSIASPDMPNDEATRRSSATLERIKYYPMVLVVCYFFATIHRIVQIFGPQPFWLSVLHTIGASSQGTLNCIVYGLTPSVRSAFLTLIYPVCARVCGAKMALRLLPSGAVEPNETPVHHVRMQEEPSQVASLR